MSNLVGTFVKKSNNNWDYVYQTTLVEEAQEPFCFFLSGQLSQWYPSSFHDPSLSLDFSNCEQYMMLHKALTFGDKEITEKIMSSDSPSKVKVLGRRVKNYDDYIWSNKRYDIVLKGNMMKFSQNPHLKEILLYTRDATIAETNPRDKIWGIGLSETDPRRFNKNLWGQNLLGKALMEVRSKLRRERSIGD